MRNIEIYKINDSAAIHLLGEIFAIRNLRTYIPAPAHGRSLLLQMKGVMADVITLLTMVPKLKNQCKEKGNRSSL